MTPITDIAALEALYPTPPAEAAIVKVADHVTPLYRRWIERARFAVLSTVGPEGTDGSPRGDDGPVVSVLDDRTLLMPDWRGNNRIDSLRNIVRDGRVSLMLMVPGATNVVRINGTAVVAADENLIARFETQGRRPRSVIAIRVEEIYTQCARALIRSRLWAGEDESAGLPSVGDILAERSEGRIDGGAYDAEWPVRAAQSMW